MAVSTQTYRPMPHMPMIPMIREVSRKGFLQFLVDNWRAQGDVFSFSTGASSTVFVAHPEQVKYISITNGSNFTKGKTYDTVRKLLLGNGLVSSTGELWRRQRKLMAPFFTPRAVEHYAAAMVTEGEALRIRWEGLAKAGQPVEMIDEMMRITAAIIVRTMFSVTDMEKALSLTDVFEALIRVTSDRSMNPLSPPLWMPTTANRAYHAARHRVDTFIQGLITERRAMSQTDWPDDLLTRLMAARDDETGAAMPDQQVLDEAVTIFFAGHETTARTLSFTFYALAKNPEVAARLHAEIDREIGDRLPTFDDLKRLSYTLYVLQETLRLYPAAPVYPRDAIADDVIGGHFIKAGTTMMLSPFITHRHPDFWPEPETFNPDRWLPENEKARHPYAYHPFAAGQRVCIGNNFSLFESHVLLTLLGQHFAPRLVEGHQIQLDMLGTLVSKTGIPMIIEPRR